MGEREAGKGRWQRRRIPKTIDLGEPRSDSWSCGDFAVCEGGAGRDDEATLKSRNVWRVQETTF